MLKHFFGESSFTIQYTLKNKIKFILLANTYASRYSFIDEKFMKKICQVFEIKFQYLILPKQIQRFDGKTAKPIIHIIYLTLIIDTYTKSLVFLFIIRLGYYSIIFG